jgi:rhamnosyl/mannosyltransferase
LPEAKDTVWHLHEPFPLGTLALLLHSAGSRTLPAVVTWHSDVVRQRALKPIHTALARQLLRRVAFIHVPSEAHITSSEILPDFREKVRVIPFIVDVEAMRRQPERRLAIDLRNWASGSPLALVVARLVYYKGVDVLLDALALSPCARLVVVGDGPLRNQLSRHAIALGVADRVRWLGTVTDDDLVGAFSAADFFVLPSVARSEAFGLVQVEAMAAGLPVISTRLGTAVEVVNIDDTTGLLVEPRNPGALADALRRLSNDVTLRARLAAGALEHAKHFAESQLVERYRELYASAREAA